MKSKLYLLSLTVILLFTSMTTNAALVSSNQPSQAVEQTDSRLAEIKQRVEEIRAMDKSQLSKSERKSLRNELRDMKKELKRRGGLYISTAAIIAAILLVALILVLVL